ncbi:MAG TPA: alpha-amylase family glycosyl hydrolase [Ohtaekwangia sp.]|nr:alpha-amylase family glycosyl hydrolase [Ohtaekwangia sp.]
MEYQDKYLWWQYGVVYQIYPRSFQDSNNDGIGDLKGIASRLDYLQWLGVDAIWISPIYPSPMKDFGYDISDYENIHPLFGNMDDFDRLINAVHTRGMKLILDFVPNHTSDQHPWFLESKSSRNNPKRDWYIWKDPLPGGGLPNNWLAAFGGPAWEWDEQTQQYYYHAFLKEQPDLNWRNKEVQNAMLNAMKFWLDRGVDGFRVDVMWHMIKDNQFRDNPPNPEYQQHMATYDQLLAVYSTDQPEVHDIVHMMRKLLDQYDERMMIGEIYLPIQKLIAYYGVDKKGAHLPFNFQLLTLPWDARFISIAVTEYEKALPEHGWPNWVLGNHDQPRIASRVGIEQAKVAMVLLLTLKGTPTMYYGDELGLKDVPISEDAIQDPQGLNMPDKNLSRDPARTPMQWNDSVNAGFSNTTPWLPVDRHYRKVNVEAEKADNLSMLSLVKKLVTLRKNEKALSVGNYDPVFSDHQLISFIRHEDESPRFLIILNLTHRPCFFRQKQTAYAGTVVLSTSPDIENTYVGDTITLAGDEAIIVKLDS